MSICWTKNLIVSAVVTHSENNLASALEAFGFTVLTVGDAQKGGNIDDASRQDTKKHPVSYKYVHHG
jgi:hypothetical protein